MTLNLFNPNDDHHVPIVLPFVPKDEGVKVEWHEELLLLKHGGCNLSLDLEISKLQVAVDVIAWAIKSGVTLEQLKQVHKELTL